MFNPFTKWESEPVPKGVLKYSLTDLISVFGMSGHFQHNQVQAHKSQKYNGDQDKKKYMK